MLKKVLLIISVIISLQSIVFTQYKEVPANQVSQVLITACVFEKTISGLDQITLYVMGNNQVAQALGMYINQNLGNTVLKQIDSGTELPATKPTILFIANGEYSDQAIIYCQKNRVLSITNIPGLVEKGISLGIGMDDHGKLVLLLNPRATAGEGKQWNPAVMKMAKIIR